MLTQGATGLHKRRAVNRFVRDAHGRIVRTVSTRRAAICWGDHRSSRRRCTSVASDHGGPVSLALDGGRAAPQTVRRDRPDRPGYYPSWPASGKAPPSETLGPDDRSCDNAPTGRCFLRASRNRARPGFDHVQLGPSGHRSGRRNERVMHRRRRRGRLEQTTCSTRSRPVHRCKRLGASGPWSSPGTVDVDPSSAPVWPRCCSGAGRSGAPSARTATEAKTDGDRADRAQILLALCSARTRKPALKGLTRLWPGT